MEIKNRVVPKFCHKLLEGTQIALLPAANDPCPWHRIRSGKVVNISVFLSPQEFPPVHSIPVAVPLDFRGKEKKIFFHKESKAIRCQWPDSGMALGRAWGDRKRDPVPSVLKFPIHPGLLPRILSWCFIALALRFSTKRLHPKGMSESHGLSVALPWDSILRAWKPAPPPAAPPTSWECAVPGDSNREPTNKGALRNRQQRPRTPLTRGPDP